MNILSIFPERFKELMFDKNTNSFKLSKALKISSSTTSQYSTGRSVPSYDNLVKLVEYFDCSADFLLGLTEYPKRENQVFLPVVPFEIQFRKALKTCGVSQYALNKRAGISWENINDWLHGRNRPLSDTLVRIADELDCSVDFLLGREN